jgi:hypothetical protein
VILEIVIPMNYTRITTDVTGGHVPENGGTCAEFTVLCLSMTARSQSALIDSQKHILAIGR